jgi:hypothetical protein
MREWQWHRDPAGTPDAPLNGDIFEPRSHEERDARLVQVAAAIKKVQGHVD